MRSGLWGMRALRLGESKEGARVLCGGWGYLNRGEAVGLGIEECVGVGRHRGKKVFQIGNGTCIKPQSATRVARDTRKGPECETREAGVCANGCGEPQKGLEQEWLGRRQEQDPVIKVTSVY